MWGDALIFWIFCSVLTLAVAAMVLRPMVRPDDTTQASPDVAFYKAQLAEIDSDLARDVITEDEAERARIEVSRRLIQADARHTAISSGAGGVAGALVAGGAVIAIAAATYWQLGAPGAPDLPLAARLAAATEMRENRPDQAALEAAAPQAPMPEGLTDDYLAQIAQLRVLVPQRPDDLRGWSLLSYHEAELRNFASAARAQTKVVALKGDDATLEDRRLLLDYLVAAADGYVSQAAEDVAREILAVEPEHVPARYYLGALAHQTDRSDIAFRLWRPLVEGGADTFHTALARLQIEDAAARAGVDYTLPAFSGPTLEDVEAAEDMSEDDRTAMIAGMIGQLSDRLATQGGSASEWARLIGAYGVLGDTENANAIWTEAQGVFATDPDAMAILRAAASGAGVAE